MIIDKIRIGNTSYDIGVDYSNVDGTPTKLSDFTNDEGFIDKNVNNLTNYTPSSQTTSQLELVLNSENYKLKGILKDSTGSTIYTSNEIDLPLESVVVSGAYDSQTKEVVLTLVNGSTIRFSVADLVSGLVSFTDLATALANYYTKTETDTLLGGKQPNITSTNKLSADLVDDTNATNKFVSASDKTTWSAKYDKPATGIPSTDLSSAVQTSLGKADTAIQDVSDKQDTIQYSTMPTADSTTVGKIVQYIGTTDSTYTNGYFYIGTEDNGTYAWENINIQEGSISNETFIIKSTDSNASRLEILNAWLQASDLTNGKFANLIYFVIGSGNASNQVLNQTNIYFKSTYIYISFLRMPITSDKLYSDVNGYLMMLTYSGDTITTQSVQTYFNLTSTIANINTAQTITGVKTFSALPESSVAPTSNNQFANKKYVDDSIASAITSALGGNY